MDSSGAINAISTFTAVGVCSSSTPCRSRRHLRRRQWSHAGGAMVLILYAIRQQDDYQRLALAELGYQTPTLHLTSPRDGVSSVLCRRVSIIVPTSVRKYRNSSSSNAR